jgi:hypothetical protein
LRIEEQRVRDLHSLEKKKVGIREPLSISTKAISPEDHYGYWGVDLMLEVVEVTFTEERPSRGSWPTESNGIRAEMKRANM